MKRHTTATFSFLLALILLIGIGSAQPAIAAEATGEQITLRMMGWLENGQDGMRAVADLFEAAHSNVKIEIELLDTTQYLSVYMARMASGECADVMSVKMRLPDLINYDAGGYVADLSDLSSRSNFKDGADLASQYNGIIQALPVMGDVWGVWYNNDILKDLGLSFPKTRGEFVAACQAAKDAGILPIANGLQDGWTTWMSVWTLWGKAGENDPTFFDRAQAGEVSFASNADLKWGLDIMKEYYDAGFYLKDLVGTPQQSAEQMFFNGEALFLPTGSWFLNDVKAANPSFEYRFGLQPYNDEVQDGLVSEGGYSFSLAAYAKSPHVETAKDFINFFFQPENYIAYCDATAGATGSVLKNIDVGDNPAEQDIYNNMTAYVMDLYPGGVCEEALFSGVQAMIAGLKTSEQVLIDMDEAMQRSLNKK